LKNISTKKVKGDEIERKGRGKSETSGHQLPPRQKGKNLTGVARGVKDTEYVLRAVRKKIL